MFQQIIILTHTILVILLILLIILSFVKANLASNPKFEGIHITNLIALFVSSGIIFLFDTTQTMRLMITIIWGILAIITIKRSYFWKKYQK
ncbi:MAG: hypothetical protein L3J07_00245 [Candidatus Magasanikbacteria bacterium]|nr:hypothetical protein [Candidatus Magasanikbacteria bacterium]